jgi:hypothetical protein
MALTDEDKSWIIEQLHDMETKLLTAFHRWASPVDLRVRSHSAAIAAAEMDIENLGDRVKKLEGDKAQ